MIPPPPRSTLFPRATLFRSALELGLGALGVVEVLLHPGPGRVPRPERVVERGPRSEEHTLNSSHSQISYAVFCLKKKTGRISRPGSRLASSVSPSRSLMRLR